MEQRFYNLSHGGPEGRALPVVVKRITHFGHQTWASSNQIMELGVADEGTDALTRLLERDYPRVCHLIDSLHEDLTTTRADV
mgnify:CR=1 FL=1